MFNTVPTISNSIFTYLTYSVLPANCCNNKYFNYLIDIDDGSRGQKNISTIYVIDIDTQCNYAQFTHLGTHHGITEVTK